MKIADPHCMNISIPNAGRQLLKNIHVSKLKLVMSVCVIIKPCKKTILIKRIINYFLAKVDMHFVIYAKRKSAGSKSIFV